VVILLKSEKFVPRNFSKEISREADERQISGAQGSTAYFDLYLDALHFSTSNRFALGSAHMSGKVILRFKRGVCPQERQTP
jgi:tRNA G37 N-methylase TrmD